MIYLVFQIGFGKVYRSGNSAEVLNLTEIANLTKNRTEPKTSVAHYHLLAQGDTFVYALSSWNMYCYFDSKSLEIWHRLLLDTWHQEKPTFSEYILPIKANPVFLFLNVLLQYLIAKKNSWTNVKSLITLCGKVHLHSYAKLSCHSIRQ